MSFSYGGDPGSSELDEIRFYLGDTDENAPFLSDEEIGFLIDRYGEAYGHMLGVAALGAEMLAAKFAREVTVSADGVSVAVGELQQRFNDLAASLRDQYHALNLDVSFDQIALDTAYDPLIPPLSFAIGFTDNREAGQQDFGGDLRPVW